MAAETINRYGIVRVRLNSECGVNETVRMHAARALSDVKLREKGWKDTNLVIVIYKLKKSLFDEGILLLNPWKYGDNIFSIQEGFEPEAWSEKVKRHHFQFAFIL